MKRLTLILLFLTFCATAFAGESQLKQTTNVLNESMGTPGQAISGRSAEPAQGKTITEVKMMERCQAMKEQKQKMKEDMKAQDAQLTEQLAQMNRAPEDKKMDLMAALITHMVEQRITMDARKAKMDEEMMKHMMQHMQMGKESMSQCPMMKGIKDMNEKSTGAHKEHHVEQK